MKSTIPVRVRLSRLINRYVLRGKPNQMICTRLYVSDIRWAIKIADTIFFFHEEHCRRCFYYDLANGGYTKREVGNEQI